MDMAYSPAVDAQKYDNLGKRNGNFLPPVGAWPYKADYHYEIDVKNPITGTLTDQGKKFCSGLEMCAEPKIIPNNGAGVLVSPFKPDADLIERGKEKFNIYCSPCHGLKGKADGPVVIGPNPKPGLKIYANVLPLVREDKNKAPVGATARGRSETWPVGRIYAAVSVGINTMSSYISQIPVKRDRWAIAHYVKQLQEEAKK